MTSRTMPTWARVLVTVLCALVGMLVMVLVEVMVIGLIGGNTDGTGLVAFGLAPLAAVLGLALGAAVAWRRTSRPAPRA